MQISRECKVAMYLTGRFGKLEGERFDPLKSSEWHDFSSWLSQNNVAIGNLNEKTVMELPLDWEESNFSFERISDLLKRSFVLDERVHRWVNTGLWMLTPSDANYPELLKSRLKEKSPPVLYGCGDSNLFCETGVAIVGSRNATEEDLEYSSGLAKDLVSCGLSVVSGGARGVDQAAMLGALENHGISVGVLANDLRRLSTSSLFRKHLTSKLLVLISPFHPESRFTAGNAMARNQLIYALAQSAVVITCEENSGGSWNGAIDNLKAAWRIPLWVKKSGQGNNALNSLGAFWLPESGAKSIDQHLKLRSERDQENKFFDLFLRIARKALSSGPISIPKLLACFAGCGLTKKQLQSWLDRATDSGILEKGTVRKGQYSLAQPNSSFFDLFKYRLEEFHFDGPKTVKKISEHFAEFGFSNNQIRVGLSQASNEGLLQRNPDKRTEYVLVEPDQSFFDLFKNHVQDFLAYDSKSLQELSDHYAQYGLSKRQVSVWLNQAAEEGLLEKKQRRQLEYALFDKQRPKQGELPL